MALVVLLATLPATHAADLSPQEVEAPADTMTVAPTTHDSPATDANGPASANEGGEAEQEEGERETGNDATVAVVTITCLIALSILFEVVRYRTLSSLCFSPLVYQ